MDQHMMGRVQEALQAEHAIYQALQKPMQKLSSTKAQYMAQIHETTDVLHELNLVEDDSEGTVYKLFGPVLVKQDLDEAKSNVQKRLSFMQDKLKSVDADISKCQADMEKSKEKMAGIQDLFKRAQLEMAKAQQQQQVQ